jgi:hypothetical protein
MAIFNSKLLVITRGFSAISARGLRPTWPCVVEDLKGHVPASASVAKPMEFPAVHPQQSWNRWDLWWFTMILWWYYDDFLMILWRFVMILWWFLRMIFELRPSQLWYIAFDPSPSGLLLALQTALSIHLWIVNEIPMRWWNPLKSNPKEYLKADFADFDMTFCG